MAESFNNGEVLASLWDSAYDKADCGYELLLTFDAVEANEFFTLSDHLLLILCTVCASWVMVALAPSNKNSVVDAIKVEGRDSFFIIRPNYDFNLRDFLVFHNTIGLGGIIIPSSDSNMSASLIVG